MKRSLAEFATLDDIGFIGIPNYRLTPEDVVVFARKGEEARIRYHEAKAQEARERLAAYA
ncbi:MAG: hypothetical protein LBC85_02760 [Fibromonadaceae bacterium]|jgi:hypothetical protein|nr:hypothetical protein [Fibromonadaceae bacterium]